jgi:hypothetical protein
MFGEVIRPITLSQMKTGNQSLANNTAIHAPHARGSRMEEEIEELMDNKHGNMFEEEIEVVTENATG